MKAVPKWLVYVPQGTRMARHVVSAHTKGEARAAARRELGIPGKRRLPVGSLVEHWKG